MIVGTLCRLSEDENVMRKMRGVTHHYHGPLRCNSFVCQKIKISEGVITSECVFTKCLINKLGKDLILDEQEKKSFYENHEELSQSKKVFTPVRGAP